MYCIVCTLLPCRVRLWYSPCLCHSTRRNSGKRFFIYIHTIHTIHTIKHCIVLALLMFLSVVHVNASGQHRLIWSVWCGVAYWGHGWGVPWIQYFVIQIPLDEWNAFFLCLEVVKSKLKYHTIPYHSQQHVSAHWAAGVRYHRGWAYDAVLGDCLRRYIMPAGVLQGRGMV